MENRCTDMEGFALPSWQDVLNRHYEPWDREHLIVDTAHKSIEACLREITAYLQVKYEKIR